MFVGTAGKATWRVHFPGRSPHDINAAFRDKGQSSVFLPCLFPRHHPHKDKVSGAFFNLLYFNWWEKVVPLIGALSWMDLIRSNDQINGEFWIRTFGDWVVWRGLCCYISLHLSLWWEEKQSANGSQTWILLHGRGRREDLGSSVGSQQRRYSEQKRESAHLWASRVWSLLTESPYVCLTLLPRSPVSQTFVSPWPWHLCHIFGKPRASPRMGKVAGSLVKLPWSWCWRQSVPLWQVAFI